MGACFHVAGVQCDNCRTGLVQPFLPFNPFESEYAIRWAKGWRAVSLMCLEDQGVVLRLAVGDKVYGAFVGEPYASEAPYPEPDQPRLQIALNFWSLPEGVMRVLIFDTKTFREIVQIRDKYDFDQWVFSISGVLDEAEKKTRLLICPERKLDPAKESVSTLQGQGHDLAAFFASRQRVHSPAPLRPVEDKR